MGGAVALAPIGAAVHAQEYKAQQASRVYRVGVMAIAPTPHLLAAWQQGLRDHGWIEGQNIAVEYRYSQGNDTRFAEFAAEFVRLKVDVIGAVSEPAVRAAKQATSTIPIVMVAATVSEFAANLARPEANITGFRIFADDLAGKQLQLLKETVPRGSRISVLYSANEVGRKMLEAAQIAGLGLGLTLEPLAVDMPVNIEGALGSVARRRPDAILVLPSNSSYLGLRAIIEFAAVNQLPTMYPYREAAVAGGLIAYTTFFPDVFQRHASYIDRILRGAKVAELPVQQPTKFELVINLKTAKALGLTIPQSLLLRADQVIE
jgi:putative tryptophan/tyrosine transport system substrate-binding protein